MTLFSSTAQLPNPRTPGSPTRTYSFPVLCDQTRLGRRFASPYRRCAAVTHHDIGDALTTNDNSISEIRPVAAAAHVGIPGAHVQNTGWIGAEDRVRFVQDFVGH